MGSAKRSIVVSVLLLALALTGCGSDEPDGPTATSAPPATTAGEAHTFDIDADRTIEAEVGDTIELRLDANVTTGYSWSQQIEGGAVEEVSGEYEAPRSQADGAGGTQVYVYRVVEAGTATIELTYTQVGSEDVGQQYTVTVQAS